MRKTWKEVGLAFLNLTIVAVAITLLQLTLPKHLGARGTAVVAVVCLGTYLAAVKWVEWRAPVELAAGRALPEMCAGLLTGFGLFSTTMAILWLCRVYDPSGWGTYHGIARGFGLALSAGIVEEILFRGLLFRICSKLFGTWGALLAIAAVFGFAHHANPGATLGSSAAIALEAGILLGAAYASTSRLWLPIGLHIGWNFTEGSVYGMNVSGFDLGAGAIRGSLSGPQFLTGGAFGPEASLVAVIVCLAAAFYFIGRIIRLRLAEPPIWSKAKRDGSALPAATAGA